MPGGLASFIEPPWGDLPSEQVIFGCSAAMQTVRGKVELALDRREFSGNSRGIRIWEETSVQGFLHLAPGDMMQLS